MERLGLLFTGELFSGPNSSKSATKLFNQRAMGREITAKSVESGKAIYKEGVLTVVRMCPEMRNEFLPALLPKAVVILTTEVMKSNPDRWVARFRLGEGAPEGFTLKSLEIDKNIDPAFGGRWNAGSNSRGGGTNVPLEEYVKKLEAIMKEKLKIN